METVHLEIVGFLRTVFYIIAFYYLGKFLVRWWLKQKIGEQTRRMNNSVNEQEADFIRKDKGQVTIKKSTKGPSLNTGNSGDYVDYEEVD